MRLKNNKAFSLLEMMIVVVLIGIIAAFAIPNHARALERAYEQAAINNLGVMYRAFQLYASRHDGQYPADLSNLDEINQTLDIYIVDPHLTYRCENWGWAYTCIATHDSGWETHTTDFYLDGLVHCYTVQPCPITGVGTPT